MGLIVFALLFVTEWCLKAAVRRSQGLPRLFLGGRIRICYCQNRGIALGYLRHHPRLAKGIPLASALLMTVLWCWFASPFSEGPQAVAAGLLFAGAWNNVLDRIVHGFVTDYLCFPRACIRRLRSVVFNLADFYLFVGVVFALILSFIGEFL